MELEKRLAKRLGHHVRSMRGELGDTIKDCAAKLDLNPEYVVRIEKGSEFNISRDVLDRIALKYIIGKSRTSTIDEIASSPEEKISALSNEDFKDFLDIWLLPLNPEEEGQQALRFDDTKTKSEKTRELPNDKRREHFCALGCRSIDPSTCRRCRWRFQCHFHNDT